jgi:hypothetical protein
MEKTVITENSTRTVIWHNNFNLDKKDNLAELPEEEVVFGIFAIVNDEPVNCRYVGETEDLRRRVKDLFENPPGLGMKTFMQGPWIPMLVYRRMPGSLPEERQKTAEDWVRKYKPNIDEDGEYPGYYD